MDLFVAAGRRAPRRRLSVTLSVTAALAGLLVAAVVPAAGPAQAAASGSVVVTVVGADTGAALEGVCADASSPDPAVPGSSGCAEPGQTEVVLGGLVDGAEYVVNVTVGGFTGYLPPVVSTQTVVAPADVVFTAQRAVVVTGSLEYTDGTLPRSGIVVMDPVPGPAVPFSPSGFIQSGRYEVRVPAGDYTIRFQDSATGVSQWAVGATSAATATVFSAVEGVPLVVDDTLLVGSGGVPVPGVVTGRVTDAVTGAPIAGICPLLASEFDRPAPPASCDDLGVTPTAADGTYSTSVDSGDYQLWMLDPGGRYALSRRPVSVTARGTTVRDVELAVGGQVSGRAVDASTLAPLADLCVEVSVGRTPEPTGTPACTDADGRWTTAQVLPGQVTVRVLGDSTHVTQWAPGGDTQTQAGATVFTVAPAASVSAGTVRMPRGATVTGRVTDRRGRPVGGAWVVVGRVGSRAGAGGGG
ncbi:MAG: hypothetical protein HY830_07485, partial [Actinobacteria bacterium]|nr:hypothetical protein [Actinomycetota bacterium]